MYILLNLVRLFIDQGSEDLNNLEANNFYLLPPTGMDSGAKLESRIIQFLMKNHEQRRKKEKPPITEAITGTKISNRNLGWLLRYR